MKRRLQSVLLSLPFFEATCRRLTRGQIRALMYHRFSPRATGDPRFISADLLTRQLDYIMRHHRPITPDEHRRQHVGEVAAPGPCPVVVTIDDGYRDTLEVAHPLLRERTVPAMLFMTTRLADGDFWFWWDKIEYVVDQARPGVYEFEVLGRTLTLDLTSDEGKRRAWSDVADRCRFAANEDKLAFIADLAGRLDVWLPASPPEHYGGVTWDELRTMVDEGLLVGAHTQSHPILSRVSHQDAEREIHESRARLEDQLGRAIRWFCYPQGGPADYHDDICAFLEREGFAASYLAYPISEPADDPYRMPRYCVSDDMVEFRWVLCGAEWLVRRVKARFGRQHDLGASYWGT